MAAPRHPHGPQDPRHPPHRSYPSPGGYPAPQQRPGFWQTQVEGAIAHQRFLLRHKKILIAVVVLLFLCAGTAVCGVPLLGRVLGPSDSPPPVPGSASAVSAVDGRMDGIRRSYLDQAYGFLCRATKRAYSRAEFVAHVSRQKRIERLGGRGNNNATPAAAASRTPDRFGSVLWGTVNVTVIYVDGSTENRTFAVVTEDDTGGPLYKVCGDPY